MGKKQESRFHDADTICPLSEVAAEAEKAHIKKALQSTKGNKTKAAEMLCISRKTLWEKLKTFEIDHMKLKE